MFPSLLRRPRPARRRVESLDHHGGSGPGPASATVASPWFAPSRSRPGRIPTADFTEDDDDATENDFEGIGASARFVNRKNVDRRQQAEEGEDEDEDEDEEEEEDNEDEPVNDGRRRALPVLPLFSTTHLGMSPYTRTPFYS